MGPSRRFCCHGALAALSIRRTGAPAARHGGSQKAEGQKCPWPRPRAPFPRALALAELQKGAGGGSAGTKPGCAAQGAAPAPLAPARPQWDSVGSCQAALGTPRPSRQGRQAPIETIFYSFPLRS